MVHHRHTRKLPAAEARILLLQLNDAPEDLSTVALGASWAQSVMAIFGGGNTPPAGWRIADSGNAARTASRDLDARTPVAVEFAADLSHALTAPATRDQVLLLAIVTSTSDPVDQSALTQPDLESLLRQSGHTAARRVHRRA